MIPAPILRDTIEAAFGFTAGFAVGVTHFASLQWNAQFFANGSVGKAIAVQFVRIAIAVSALALLMLLSPFASLFGAVGFLTARMPMLRRFGEQP